MDKSCSIKKILIICLLCALSSLFIPNTVTSGTRGIKVSIKDPQGENISLYSNSYALVIGASDYKRGWPQLRGVIDDVEAVKSSLEKNGFTVEVVTDPDKNELTSSIENFINKYGMEVDNRLLFYFAGHGYTSKSSYGEDMGYIVPVDAPNPNMDSKGFFAKSVDMQIIEVYAKHIQSKHALFVFDSCFSGSIFALSRAIPQSISSKTAQPVRQFITSGGADEQVPDKSVFAKQFVSGISGEADLNNDGYVTGSELGQFLQDTVINYTRGSQNPQYGKIRNPKLDRGDFVFVSLGVPDVPAVKSKDEVEQKEPPNNRQSDYEILFWESIKDTKNPDMYKAYLNKFPAGVFADVARMNIEQYSQPKTNILPSKDTTQKEAPTASDSITKKGTPKDSTQKTAAKKEPTVSSVPSPPVVTVTDSTPLTIAKIEPMVISANKISLRSLAEKVSTEGNIKQILNKYGFYDSELNRYGKNHNEFRDNKDGTITDYSTGLMWQRSGSQKELSYSSAFDYIKSLNEEKYAGYSDWRMPTIEELASIIRSEEINNTYIESLFDSGQPRCWSSDPADTNQQSADEMAVWFADYKSARIRKADWFTASRNNNNRFYSCITDNYIRAVRSIKTNNDKRPPEG